MDWNSCLSRTSSLSSHLSVNIGYWVTKDQTVQIFFSSFWSFGSVIVNPSLRLKEHLSLWIIRLDQNNFLFDSYTGNNIYECYRISTVGYRTWLTQDGCGSLVFSLHRIFYSSLPVDGPCCSNERTLAGDSALGKVTGANNLGCWCALNWKQNLYLLTIQRI